jgi:hypothetical protein
VSSCRDERALWLSLPFEEQNATRLMSFSLAGIPDRSSRPQVIQSKPNDQGPIGLPFRTRLQGSYFGLPFNPRLPLFERDANSASPLVGNKHPEG